MVNRAGFFQLIDNLMQDDFPAQRPRRRTVVTRIQIEQNVLIKNVFISEPADYGARSTSIKPFFKTLFQTCFLRSLGCDSVLTLSELQNNIISKENSIRRVQLIVGSPLTAYSTWETIWFTAFVLSEEKMSCLGWIGPL